MTDVELDNQEEDRGFVEEMTPGYIFCTIWISIFFLATIVVYYYLLKSSPYKHQPEEPKKKPPPKIKPKSPKMEVLESNSVRSNNSNRNTRVSFDESENTQQTLESKNTITLSPPNSPNLNNNESSNNLTPENSVFSAHFSISKTNTFNGIIDFDNGISNNTVTKKKKIKVSKGTKISWRLGLAASTCFLIRVIFNESVWIFWDIEFDYSADSGSYISDCLMFFSNIFNGMLLYFFFIFRLYNVYNSKSSKSMYMSYKNYVYVILITINIFYGLSLTLILIAWTFWVPDLYVISQSIALCCEVTMTSIIFKLFLTPLISLTINQRKSNVTSKYKLKDNFQKQSDMLVNISTRLLVLSIFALGTTLAARVLVVASYSHCPDECWITFPTYNSFSTDAFVNIFCILCTFKNGEKYYYKYCNWIHEFILNKCIGYIISVKVKRNINDIMTPKNQQNVRLSVILQENPETKI